MMLSCTAALLSLWIWRSCWVFHCEPPPLFQTQLDLRLLYLGAWSIKLNPCRCLTGPSCWPDLSTRRRTLHETSWTVETDEEVIMFSASAGTCHLKSPPQVQTSPFDSSFADSNNTAALGSYHFNKPDKLMFQHRDLTDRFFFFFSRCNKIRRLLTNL